MSIIKKTARNPDGTICAKPLEPGQKHNRLTVVARAGKKGHNWMWILKCDCGAMVNALASNVRTGNTQSCGCHRRAVSKDRVWKHGMSNTRAYVLWRNMINRCHDPKDPGYSNYGGRGIAVCERWHQFQNFYADMGDRPAGRSLDRKDNDAGYSPDNCRWATAKEQGRNTRNNVYAVIGGVRKLVADWASETGIPYARIQARRSMGWTDDELLLPKRPTRAMAVLR